MIDKERIENGVREMLLGIGLDLESEGLHDTPRRMADFYTEMFAGLEEDPTERVKLYTSENHEEMIILKDISFYSMCEHHLLPFFGTVHVAYLPKNHRITGISSIVKMIETFCRRPQIQERMTGQIADLLMAAIQPYGVLIYIEAEHLCMTMRGVRKPGSKVVTSAIRGVMRAPATRAEALAIILGRRG